MSSHVRLHNTAHQYGGDDIIGTATPGANAIPMSGADGKVVRGFLTQPGKTIVVAKSGGDYTSISSACASITDSGPTNTYEVFIHPGVYTENLITIPSYVSVRGSDIGVVIIEPAASSHDVVHMSQTSWLGFCCVRNAGTGYYGVACRNTGDFTLLHKVTFFGCDKGLLCYGSTVETQVFLEYCDFDGDFSRGVDVISVDSAGAYCNCENHYHYPDTVDPTYYHFVSGIGAGLYLKSAGALGFASGDYVYVEAGGFADMAVINVENIENGLHVTGDNSYAIVNACSFLTCGIGIYADNTGSGASIRVGSSSFGDCTANINIDNANTTGYYTGYEEPGKTLINDASAFFITGQQQYRIDVAKRGGDYTSIKSACDSITDSSATKPYEVLVAPGVYTESPFTIPQFVSVIGLSGPSTSIVQTDDNNNHYITMSNGSLLSNCAVKGPTGTNFAAVNVGAAVTIPPQCLAVAITAGYFGFRCHSPDTSSVTLLLDRCAYVPPTAISRFATVTSVSIGSASIIATNCGANSSIPGRIGTGYYASGSSAAIRCIGCTYKDASGAGFYADEGADLNMVGCDVLGASKGIHVGASGSGTVVDAVGVSIAVGVTNSVYVDSNSAIVRLAGAAAKGTLYAVSGATVAASLLDSTTGEEGAVILGELWLGAPASTIPLRAYGLATYSTGRSSGGVVTRGTAAAVDVTAGYGFVNDDTNVVRVDWDAVTDLAVPAGDFYIYVTSAGVVSAAASAPSYVANILLASGRATASAVLLLSDHYVRISHGHALRHEYAENVVGNICVSGCIVSKSATALKLDVDSGKFYVADMEMLADVGSSVSFTTWYRLSGGWAAVSAQDAVDTANYDDGDGLSAIPTGKFAAHTLYTAVGGDGTEYHLVYAQQYYDLAAGAEGGANPTPPDFIQRDSLLLAKIVVSEEAQTDVYSVVDQRPFLGQLASGSTSVTVHDNLTGRDSITAHTQYQLMSAKNQVNGYPGLDGSGVISDTVIPSGITRDSELATHTSNASAHHAKDHATTHQHGGVDEIATATPAANAIPKANASSLLDSWVSSGAAAATPSLRALGTGALEACAGSDARLSDSRAPSGAASGDLAGTYPSPTTAKASKSFSLSGLVSDTITADQNNYSPAGFADAAQLRVSSDAERTITGLQGGTSGRLIFFKNVGSFNILLAHESTSSTDVNRFTNPGGAVLRIPGGAGCVFDYDGATNRWAVVGAPTAHAPNHQHGGADEIATATPAANAIPKASAAGQIDAGWIPEGAGSVYSRGFSITNGDNNPFVTKKSTSYGVVARFVFPGTTGMRGVPDTAVALLSRTSAGITANCRLYDLTNAQTIAEATLLAPSADNANPSIESLGTVANLPTGQSVFEVQIAGSSTSASVEIHYFNLYHS